MSSDVNFLNIAASPLASNAQPSNSLISTQQSSNSLGTALYAIRTDQTITINVGGDLDGNPLLPYDDALIYAAKGFTFNNVPILPVNRTSTGAPVFDPLTGKQVLVDNAVTVASGYTTINANNNPYIGLLPPKVVSPETITIPSYSDTKTQELNARTPLGASTITFNASSNPINNTTDWNNKFPQPGTNINPKVVRVTGGGLNIPNGVNLSNYIITVDSGDINFNGNSNILDNVVLVTSNGNINLGKVQSNNLSIFSSGAINMNSLARFGGKTLIANNSNNITFDGATKTATNGDTIKVISQGNITFNAVSDTRGDFLSKGTFTANGTAFIFGSINAKQNIIFNGGAYVTAVSSNSVPTDLLLSNSTTPENVSANALIGNFTSTDPDTTSQTFTYSLITGTGSTDNASFTIINNELRLVNPPDFESKNSYSIRVRTTDQGGLSYEKAFTVNITDVNEAPIALVLSNNTTPENIAANSLIGTFASTDADTTPQTFTYSLITGTGSTDNASFVIANNELRIVNSLNFEAKSSYSIRVRTTDQGGLSFEKVFTVGVIDINEAPTALVLSNNLTPENVAANSLIGNFTSTDPDTTLQTFTYSLVTGTGSIDNAVFSIVNNELHIVNSPDFEAKSSYSIRIRTTDQGGLSFEKVFTVSITDVNEVPTALVLSNSITPENVAANFLIGTFASTDPDTTPQTFTYSLVAGTGSTDNAYFAITNNELRIVNSPDFEAKSSYSIRIRTTDQGSLSFEKVFTISITDINEAPTTLVLSNSTTQENVLANSLIGNFTSTDPDTTSQTFTYSLITGTGSTDNASFTIIDNELRIVNPPDFEAKNSYSIRVRTTDQGGLSYEKIFTVSITDVNEAPTALVLTNNATPENVAANSLIGTFTSTDSDTTPQTLTYSLVTGTGSTDNASFEIANNELRLVTSPDFEAKNSYSIRVRTTDQGGLSYEKIFTVSITDVNEAPVLTTIENQTISVGTLLSLSAIATDPDQPTNLTYSLEPNAPEGATINPITGAFTWTPTVSQAGTYIIGVRVTDDGNPSLSNLKTFQTVVINSNLAPTDLALSPSSIAENISTNTEVGSFSSVDPDTGNSFTYSLVNGIGDINNNLFIIESGKLKLNFSPDFESKNSYSIRVKTTDQGGLSFEKALIISITDVNESPTALVLNNNITPENVAANALIGNFTSTDPDSITQTFTYSLVVGTGSLDNTSFSIINNALYIINSPNFETKNSYSIRVRTTDQGGLSYEKVFTVNITNINEAPVFTNTVANSGSAGQLYQYNITTSDPENDSRDIIAASLPSWLSLVDNHDGTAQLQGTPSFTDSGFYNIQLKARENSTFEHLEANQNFYISVDLSLKEQSFFSPIRSIPITIPSQPSILQFKIDGLNFDTTTLNSIHDAFEVSLVDNDGKPLTLTIGAGKSSFFNLSESSNIPALTSATTYDPITGIVKLNLTGIPANTPASLVFRLINDDADTTTQVTIKDFGIVNAPLNTLPAQQTVLPTNPSSPLLNLVNTIDVSSSILPQYERTSFNQDSKLLYANLALKNSGTYAINNPLLVAVTNISDPTIQVRNTNGFTPDGLPYYDFSALVTNGKLNQGQTTASGNLVFYNPNQVQFTYKLQVLSTLNRSPVITSQPNSEIIGGKIYTYNVKATDPDSDNLTYKLLVNPDGMTINSQTGVITWVTTTNDIGNKSISVEVSDGRGGISEQDYNLAVINTPPNRPPAFVTNPVVQAYINKIYKYDSQAIDPDQDFLTYSIVIGPDGLKVDPTTGRVEWTAPPSIILGDTVIGQINVPGQNQEFNFSGKAGQQIYFDPLQYAGSRGNWSFQVYSPSGQLVVNTYLDYYDNSLLTLNEDGNYRVVLNPGADTVGNYGFSVINPALIPITNFDTVINGTLNLGSQDNLYRFTASKGQKLYFDMLSRVYDKMDWVLYDPRNVVVASNGYMDDMEVDIQTDGEYLLAIRGRDALTTSNIYSFSIINSPLPTTPMILGTTVSGSLKKGEQDTFTFIGTAGQQLFFDTLNTTNYFIAYVYDASGVQVDTFDTRYERGPDNAGLRLTSDGIYKIKIDGPGESNGAYSFRLLDKAVATPVAPDNEFSGVLGNSGYNTELFQFELTSRQYLYFDATSLGYDPSNYYATYYFPQPGGWKLYDASGQLYYSQRLWEDREGWLEAGKYTLVMQGYGVGYESRYKFNVITPELTTKPAIAFGNDVSGTLTEKGAQDYYTFTGTAGQQLYFDSLSNNPSNLNIILYDPTGREVVRTNSRSDLNPYDYAALRLTMNGTYSITVDGDSEAIGNYKFRFLNKADSPLVALDTDIMGTFDNDNLGSVGYRFNIPTQTYVYIDGQQGNGTWYIYNASGQRITGTNTNADQELYLGTGEYWLVAQGNGYGDSNYKLRIVTPDLLYSNITLNTDIIGTISEKGEQDYYRFEGKAGQVLFYDDLGTTSSIYFTLYDPNGRYTGFQVSGQGDGNPNDYAGLRLTSDGIYQINIDGSGETTGTYGFRLLNMADSPLVSLNTDIIGTFDNSDRGSVGYRFNLAERTYVYVDGQVGDGYWNVYNAGGQRVTGNYTNADQELWLNAGQYWLIAQGNSNTNTDYKLKIITPDLLTTPLTFNSDVTGSIITKGEQDYYTFTGVAGQQLFLDALGSDPNISFYLTDPFGRNVYSTSSLVEIGPDNTGLLLTKNGTYTFSVDGVGETTGNYKFRFLSTDSSPLINIGNLVQGSFDNGGLGSKAYRFKVTDKAQNIYVDMQTGQSPNAWVIYGGDGQVVARQNLPTDANVTLTKGEYWLVAIANGAANNNYQFQLNPSLATLPTDPALIPYIPNTIVSGVIAGSQIISPILTSNTAPNPYSVTASSEYGGLPAYKAFDGSIGGYNFWASGGDINPYIQIDLGTPTSISGYSFVSRADGEYNQSPRQWILSGSNDGTNFTDLDSKTGQPIWGLAEKRGYSLESGANYRYYRWTYTTQAIGQSIISIQEIQLLNAISGDTKKIYAFDATAGQSFNFDNLSTSGLQYSVIDPSGRTIVKQLNTSDRSRIFANETGTYKLIINSATESGINYSFNLVSTTSTDPAFTLYTPNTVVSGSIAGSIVSPILTSNVGSPYRVTASSEYFPAYYAFDGRETNSNGYAMWHTNGELNPFIQIDLGTSTSISGYSFVSRADGEYNQSPRQWVFAGSNDGTNFTTLDSKSEQPIWGVGEKRGYSLGDISSYRYYKWSLTAQSSIGQSYLCIQEIQLLNSVSNNGDTKKIYSFEATAGQGLYFDSLTANAGLQYSIVDPNGRTLVKQANPTSDRGEIFIGETGTYQLIIDSASGYSGNYSFNLVPYGNSSTIPTPVTLGSNISGTFGLTGQEAKFYRFTANANQLLAIDPSGDSNNYWFIYSPKGDTVASGRLSKYKEFVLNQTGEYTLVIAGNGAANTSYQLNLLAPSTTTAPLTIGTDISGNISTKGQYDTYTFTGKAGQQLFYDALGGDNYLYVTISDPTGRKVVDRANNPSDRSFQEGLILQMDGTYTLQIGGSDYSSYIDYYETYYPNTSAFTTHTGNYKFRLLDKADATVVTVGDYITGTFDNGALGSKLYKLSLTETKVLYFDTLQGNGNFRIYNPNGYEITSIGLNDGADRELTLDAGEYLILMQGTGSYPNYQLRITQPTSYLPVPITFDTVISDSIMEKGVKRYYTIDGTAGKQLYFDGLGGNFGYYLTVYDPAGKKIFERNPQSDYSPTEGLILQMDGAYQLVIDSLSRPYINYNYYGYSFVYPYLGDYKFRLLDKDNATVVNVGDDITGTFDNGALGAKAYKLTLTETKFLYFDGLQGNGTFHLYSPDGQEITSLGLNDGHDREFNLGAGEYLIVMQGNGSDTNYKLHISEPIIPPTESIDLGAVVSGNISEKGVKRNFTFTGVAGHQLFYDALGSDYNFVAIYDPTGRRVFFQDGRYDYNPYDGGSYGYIVNNSTGLILQMDGTYTVVIDSSDRDYYRYYGSQYDYVIPQLGNYKFRLLDKTLAPETTLDTVVSGTSDNGGLGTTQYRLNISERKYVYFDAQGGSGNWIVYSPDGKTRVAYAELNRSQEFWLDAGEYTIAIQGIPQGSNTVPYQFKIVTPDLITTAYKVGDIISSSISEKGEKDYYTFEGKTGQRLFFDGLSTTANIYATLTSPTGKVIFSRLDTQSNYANEVLDENGIYTLTVDGSSYDYYGNVSQGNYSLRLLEYANASSFTTSQAVLVQTNVDITGSFSDANGKQSNLYRFSGTQGQTLYIDTIAGDASNFWGIYAPNGTSVTNGNLSSPSELVLSQTGEYTLEVQGRGTSNRDYTIRLIMPNSSIANYALGNVVNSSLDRKGETDTYNFAGKLGQKLFFDSITAPTNVRARLYSPSDVLLKDRLLNTGDWIPETLAETGNYRLVIDGDGAAIGDYSFSLSDRSTAPVINLATLISGNVEASRANLYKLNGEQGQVLNFNLTGSTLVGAAWIIYDPTGIALAAPSSASPDFNITLASTGLYSLVINGDSGGGYSFEVTDITPTAIANSGLGVLQTASFNAGQTVDYEFTGKAGTQIYFDAQAYNPSNYPYSGYYGGYEYYSFVYSRFRLINPDGTTALDNQSATSDQILTLSQTGIYKLQAYSAYPYVPMDFKYNLLEMPNSFASPALNYLALNDTVTGSLNGGETKIYTFQNYVGTKVLFNGMYGDGVSATLYDPSGRVVMTLGINYTDSAPYTLTQDGLYHLVISGQATNHSYAFQLLDASPAQEVEFNLPITGFLDNGEKGTFYKITTDANKILYFDNLSFNTNWYYPNEYRWTLYGAGNNVIANNELRSDFEVKIGKAGEYFLYVAGAYATNRVDYKFRVISNDINARRDVIVPGNGRTSAQDDGSLATVSVELQAKDGKGGSANQNYDIKLFADPNNATPVITSTPEAKYSLLDNGYRYQVKALDPDNDSLVYRLIKSPIGAIIDRDTGELFWFPPSTFTPGSQANFTVEVSDARGGKDTQTFIVDVNNLGKIQGRIWNDANGDGNQEPTEDGLVGVEVFLDADDDGIYDPTEIVTNTDDSGNYLFSNLVPARYVVREVLPNQFVYSFPDYYGSNLIKNGSFELNTTVGALFNAGSWYEVSSGNSTSISDWTVRLDTVDVCSTSLWQASDGNYSIDLNGSRAGGITQVIDTIPGSLYTVTFDLSGHGLAARSLFDMTVTAAGQSAVFTGTSPGGTSDMQYKSKRWTFTATEFTTEIGFFSYIDGGYGPVIDNVKVSAVNYTNERKYVVNLGLGETSNKNDFGNKLIVTNPTNTSPVFTASNSPTTTTVGEVWRYNFKATDSDFDPLKYELISAPVGMAIDSKTGIAVWKPTLSQLYSSQNVYDQNGTYSFVVRVEDGKGGSDVEFVKVSLLPINTPPVFTSIFPTTTPQANKTFQYQAKAIDPNNDPVTFSLVTAPSGASINASTGLLTWQPTTYQVGDNSFTLKVIDGKGGESLQTGKLSVINAVSNRVPIISSTPRNSARYGNSYSYEIAATDPDGDTLTYSLVTAPAGMTIKDNILSWQPSSTQFGDNNVSVKVTDVQGGTSTQTFKVKVGSQLENNAPTISSTPNLVTTIDREYQYELSGSDLNGDRILWSLDKAPTGMVIDANTGKLRWQPTSSQIGEQMIAIRLTDNYGAYSVQEYTLKVNAINSAPNIVSTPITQAGQGQPYVYNVVATDAENDAIRYSLLSHPNGMEIDSNTGEITWTPSYSTVGSYNIQIQATDSKGIFNTQSYKLEIVAAPNLTAINHAPSITSTPIAQTDTTKPYQYQVVATDVDAGDSLSYGLINSGGATGLAINPTTGLVTWNSPIDGTYNIEIGVTDTSGARATQGFTLNVNNQPSGAFSNTPPQIVSTPITRIGQGQPYIYEVLARDPENNPVTYSLKNSPEGMAIAATTGKITWTGNTVGSYNIQIQATDSQGGFSSQSYQLEVIANPINHAPSITSTPKFQADTNSPYRYQVTASDPDVGDSIEYELISNGGATGLAINASTGLLTWNSPNTGTYKVVIGAVDEGGLGAAQGFTLTARANQLPIINSDNPPTKAVPSIPYVYDIRATDPDGGVLKYSLDETSKNLGISIDEQGRVRWTPSASQIGNHPITISIIDETGGVITQNYTINVQADSTAPSVKLTYAGLIPAEKGSSITFQVQATDDVKVADLQLLVDGQAVVLDANGIATVVLNTVGNIQITAKAIDLAGNVGQDTTVSIPVFDPNAEANAHVVSLDLSGFSDNVITNFSDIKGLVDDPDNNLQSYVVDIAPVGTDNWTTVFTGNSEVSDGGVLGKFDPSIIADDSYRVRLTATDTSGLSSSVEDQLNVVSQGLKLGNFTLSFTDLSIPIAGIPINVTRTYDSLNSKTKDDFGFGWRLEFRDTDLRTSLGKDAVYEQIGLRTQAFKDGTKVFITLPGGKRETFTFNPTRDRLSGYFPAIDGYDTAIYHPAFTSEKGSTSTLTVVDTRLSNVNGKYYSLGSGVGYNPADGYFGNKYILTTKEGIVYEIDGTTGDLNTVTNPNGNTLTFTDAGITSDTGKSVTFLRDASGRITSVTDPLGQVVKYQYDAKGDLIGVSDREENTTLFKYAQPNRDHFLTEVVDPLGRSGVKNEYDAQGRLVKLVDALGKPVQLAYDPDNSTQTVTDALGNPTTYVYDQRGNVVSEVDALTGMTTRTYDDENHLLSQTDALGRTMSYTYDSFGNRLSETDALGNSSRYTFNSFGEVLTKVNALGESTRYEYDSRGNRLSLTNAEGNTAKYEFDIKGRPNAIISADGSRTSFIYDFSGNVSSQIDAMGRVTSYTYDANGNQLTETKSETLANGSTRTLTTEWTYDSNNRVTSTKDPLGNITRQEYDQVGNLIASIDPLGHRTEYEYDAKGQQVKVKYANGTFETTTYDDKGQEIAQTNQLGQTTRTVYDALGRPIESIFADATPNDLTDNPRVKTEYDAAGQIKAQIDERGNRTIFAYDLAGRRTSVTDALGNTSSYTYNSANYRLAETDALGRVTTFLYDKVGRPVKVTYADGTSTSETYDSNGRRNSSTDQAGNITRYVYNALNQPIEVIYADNTPNDLSDNPRNRTEYNELGQVVAQIDELGNRQEYEYDAAGRRIESRSDCACRRMTYAYDVAGKLTSQTDQLGHTTQFEYDNMDRLVKTIYADNTTATTTYDALGREIAKADQNGKVTQYEYDAQGRLASVIDALNQRTEYGYDLAGNLTSMKDASNHVNEYRYDALNRRVDTVLPMGQLSRVTYDAVGNMASFTNANGETITYEYDALNRLTKKNLPDETFTMTYASIGKIASVTDSRGTTTYSYDARQRLTEQIDPDGQFLRYGYNAANLRTAITTASGTTTFTYDKYKELKTVTDANGAVTSYNYDKAGNLIETDLANGVIEKRSYDLLNRLTQIESKKDSTVIFSAAYTLDNVGMRTKVVENLAGNSRTVDYTYDGLYRLLSENDGVSSTSYTYSPTGNRLTKASGAVTANYVYDANDRLLSDGISTFTYDNNGNKKTETKDGVTTTYTWDAENRLKATEGGGTSTVYDYDYSGIRVSQTVNGVETRFLVDKNRNYAQVLAEYAPSGTVQVAYIFGSDLIAQDRNGTKSFYVYDGLGSTRALTDATGNVTDTYNYDAYGNLSSSTGTTVNSYLYAGEQFDKNLGDYYLRDRYYSTDIGRFTQRDRFDGDMMNPLSLNRYGYTHGNPVNGIDPSGMFLLDQLSAISINDQLERTSLAINTAFLTSYVNQTNELVQAYSLQMEYYLDNHIPDKEEIKRRRIKLPILVWGLDYGVTSIHTDKALHGQSYTNPPNNRVSPVMNYNRAGHKREWYNNFAPCKYRSNYPSGSLVCDEFPYASTIQGGSGNYDFGGVSLSFVPKAEQSLNVNQPRGQGGTLKTFYQDAFNNLDRTRFLVFSNLNIINSYYLVLQGDSVKFGDVSSTLYTNHSRLNFEREYNRLNKYP